MELEKILLEKGSQELIVENLSMVSGVEDVIKSEEFVVGGHIWEIWFYPNGRNNGGEHASLYVLLKSESPEPVQFFMELLLLDQSGKGKHRGVSKIVDSLRVNCIAGVHKCIHGARLRSPDFVRNDCVRIRATLAVYNFVAKDLGRLLERKQWADVIIKVGDEEETSFSAHKLILAARCPALLSLQTQSHDHHTIILLPHIQPRIFKVVQTFIYIEKLCEDEQESLLRILAVAQLLELKTLKDICESRLSAASVESNGCENLKEKVSLRDNPSISIKGVFNMFNKVLNIVKKSVVDMPWSEDATYKYSKIKEA